MALRTVWCVDIGKSALKAALLRRDRNNVEVLAIDKIDYTAGSDGFDPGQAKEADFRMQEYLDVGLAPLLEAEDWRKEEAYDQPPQIYKVERIEGLPPKMVTPSKEDIARIHPGPGEFDCI